MSKNELVVVALGGNAITRETEKGDIYQQFANTRQSLIGICDLIQDGYRVVLTHGNGPQVGNMLIRVENAINLVPPIPLGVIVADTEGGMGYMIQQSLYNMLHLRGIRKEIVTILTQVIVDRDDPSILNPTKYVGPFYNEKEVEKIRRERGYILKKDANRGYRRVVPSPKPIDIFEKKTLKKLINDGIIVIAGGGGGIPVYIEDDGRLEGVDGVIDKDLFAALLANEIKADLLLILTAVDHVALNFGLPNQINLKELTLDEACAYMELEQFPPGSMGPKIQAAINYLKKGGKKVIISSVEKSKEAVYGNVGTIISV